MQGKLSLWPVEGVQEYFDLFLKLQNESSYHVMDNLMNNISRKLAQSVLQRIFPEASETPEVYTPIMDRGNDRLTLTPSLKTPVIGLGAPAFLFLEEAIKLLGSDVQIPENGDVANALGAITSKVSVERVAGIVPTVEGYYRIVGMEGFEDFETLEEAEELCLKALVEKTRDKAKRSGSSEETVSVRIEDKTAESAGGDILFLERFFKTSIKGAPDLI